jgi:hypothetical protein
VGHGGFTWLYADTQYNGIYCIFICLWATLFVESWKRVQAQLATLWGCHSIENTAADEREEFKYYEAYNETVGTIEKQRKLMGKCESFWYPFTYYILLLINVAVMAGYLAVTSAMTSTTDELTGEPIKKEDANTGVVMILTYVYSVLLVVVAMAFKVIVDTWTA